METPAVKDRVVELRRHCVRSLQNIIGRLCSLSLYYAIFNKLVPFVFLVEGGFMTKSRLTFRIGPLLFPLMLFGACMSNAATIDDSLVLGPGNQLLGTTSVPFVLNSPGLVSLTFTVSPGSSLSHCVPIDPTLPYQCNYDVNDYATIVPGNVLLEIDYQSGGPFVVWDNLMGWFTSVRLKVE